MLHLGNVQEISQNKRSRKNRSECHSDVVQSDTANGDSCCERMQTEKRRCLRGQLPEAAGQGTGREMETQNS